MNNQIVSRNALSQLRVIKGNQTEVKSEKIFVPLTGFSTVSSVMAIVEENLFAFAKNPNLCVNFRSENCNGIRFTGTVYRKVKSQWMHAGTHTFDGDGNSATISMDWNNVIICES
jgi:hypothetical protein